jgi:hypothetical protein
MRDARACDRAAFVGRIVEHLDLELAPRIHHPRRRIEETRGDRRLVVERQLNRDDRKIARIRRGIDRRDAFT